MNSMFFYGAKISAILGAYLKGFSYAQTTKEETSYAQVSWSPLPVKMCFCQLMVLMISRAFL